MPLMFQDRMRKTGGAVEGIDSGILVGGGLDDGGEIRRRLSGGGESEGVRRGEDILGKIKD